MIAAIVMTLAMPITPVVPQAHPIHTVDAIVINHVRTYTETRDEWGRSRITPHSQCWVSFWQHIRLPAYLGGGTIPFAIDRGWWTLSHTETITRCTTGWMVIGRDGVSVEAEELWVIDSPFDWEMRNRRIYRPIAGP